MYVLALHFYFESSRHVTPQFDKSSYYQLPFPKFRHGYPPLTNASVAADMRVLLS